MLYLVLVLIGFFMMGLVDKSNELYRQTDDYKDLMNNYSADVRRLSKI